MPKACVPGTSYFTGILALSIALIPAIKAQNLTPSTHNISAIYRLAGQPTGTYRESNSSDAAGIVTSIESDLVFNRLGTKLEMKSSSQYREDSGGHLKSASSDQSSSQQATHLAVEVGDKAVNISTTTGGRSYQHSIDFSGLLLGPEGGRQLLLARLRAVGDSVSYQTFSMELGSVVTITSKLMGREDFTVGQKTIKAMKIQQSMSSMPGTATLWTDQEGWMLRQVISSPLGDIEAVRDETPAANSAAVQGASLPEESFMRSIVKANIRLPRERLIDSIELKIIHQRPDLGWPELETDNQHVLEKSPNYVVLEIRRMEPGSGGRRPMAANPALTAYLAPNALLQSDDTNIQKIASEVVGNDNDAWSATRKLQQWTNENMQFDAGIAVAPASEVARNRRGTCFGYSMMLGSLLRAAGIPARLRMGYVYAGGIWGGHAWVDAQIGGRWISVDGALYSPGVADAARFSVFTSSLEDGTLAGMGALGQLFGNVDVQILRYTVAGKTVEVPDNSKPFTVRGDEYENPWLGLSIRKPASFRFDDLDSTWPDTTMLSMRGPNGELVQVKDLSASLPTGVFDAQKEFTREGINGSRTTIRITGRTAEMESSPEKAAAIVQVPGNVWEFTASGPHAEEMLKSDVSSIRIER